MKNGDRREALCSNVDDIPIGRFQCASLSQVDTPERSLSSAAKYGPTTARERRAEHREEVPNTRRANRRHDDARCPAAALRTLQTEQECIDTKWIGPAERTCSTMA